MSDHLQTSAGSLHNYGPNSRYSSNNNSKSSSTNNSNNNSYYNMNPNVNSFYSTKLNSNNTSNNSIIQPSALPTFTNTVQSSKLIEFTVIIDFTCAWCYIGKRSLELAANELNIPVQIVYQPYIYFPSIPSEGEDFLEYMTKKNGVEATERMKRPRNPVDMAGRKVGLTLTLNRKIVSTKDAHRLVLWCNTSYPAYSELLVENLFHYHLVDGNDIANRNVLLEIVILCNLNVDEANAMLSSSAFTQELIDKDIHAKNKLRISGIPYFTINYYNKRRPFNFAGAQVD